jgi:Domain of unknown function (DUF6894)
MPRFYFYVTNNAVLEDNEGTDLPSVEAAREHAHAVALELMHHRERMLAQPWDDWTMTVKDGDGKDVFSFRVCEAAGPGR